MRPLQHNQAQVIFILLGVNVLFFFLQYLVSGFTELLILIPSLALSEPWRLFTSMFLHGSLGHIFFNMYALILFGPLIIQRIGTKRFLWAYFGSGLIASLAYVFYNLFITGSNTAALGASGAIMGILGLVIMLLPQLKVLFFFIVPMTMRTAGIIFALIDIFGLFNPASGIAHIAHLGGLAVGILYGLYLVRKRKDYAKVFVRERPTGTGATSRAHNAAQKKKDDKTIELSKDDIDNYFKYGKL